MKTYSFIGSDKNAGKTTALNFVYHHLLHQSSDPSKICLSSIGINGEAVDTYEGKAKPEITIHNGSLFITAGDHLNTVNGNYRVLDIFNTRDFSKEYVLAQALTDFPCILEGPNDKYGVAKIKRDVERYCIGGFYLIDGSIDRQFIGDPAISDGIVFSLLVSERKEQLQKATDLMFALLLPECELTVKNQIKLHIDKETRSLLLTESGEAICKSNEPPFLDADLKTICLKKKTEHCTLFLNGSLSNTLSNFLAPLSNFRIVLDNFSLYQNISTGDKLGRKLQASISLLNKVPVKHLLLKQDSWDNTFPLPDQIPIHNLFRENIDEIGF